MFSIKSTFEGASSSDGDVGYYVTIKLLLILGFRGR
jgi:hypothetical protein